MAWETRASYHCTISNTPTQSVFGIYMIFNLTSLVYWQVMIDKKHCQVNIDNAHENAKWFRFDYAVGDIVYVDMTDIYHKLDYNKIGTYRITEIFKDSTVRFKRGQLNEQINISRLTNCFVEQGHPCSLGTLMIWRIWGRNVISDSTSWSIFFFPIYIF